MTKSQTIHPIGWSTCTRELGVVVSHPSERSNSHPNHNSAIAQELCSVHLTGKLLVVIAFHEKITS